MSCLPSRLQGGCGRFAVAADEEKLMETMRPSFLKMKLFSCFVMVSVQGNAAIQMQRANPSV